MPQYLRILNSSLSHLSDGVVASAPDEDIAIRVPGHHVTGGAKGKAGEVLGLVPGVEDPRLPGHGRVGGVNLPEVYMALAASHDDPVLHGMELGGHHRLGGGLGLDLTRGAGPVPDRHQVLRAVIHSDQEDASVSSGEGKTRDGSLELANTWNLKYRQMKNSKALINV